MFTVCTDIYSKLKNESTRPSHQNRFKKILNSEYYVHVLKLKKNTFKTNIFRFFLSIYTVESERSWFKKHSQKQ